MAARSRPEAENPQHDQREDDREDPRQCVFHHFSVSRQIPARRKIRRSCMSTNRSVPAFVEGMLEPSLETHFEQTRSVRGFRREWRGACLKITWRCQKRVLG